MPPDTNVCSNYSNYQLGHRFLNEAHTLSARLTSLDPDVSDIIKEMFISAEGKKKGWETKSGTLGHLHACEYRRFAEGTLQFVKAISKKGDVDIDDTLKPVTPDLAYELPTDSQPSVDGISTTGPPSPTHEHVPTSPPTLSDKLLSVHRQRSSTVIAANTPSPFTQEDVLTLPPALTPSCNLAFDPIRELLTADKQYITAVSTSPSPTQQHFPASPPVPLDEPISDHRHELSTNDRQCVIATSTPSSYTQKHVPTSQSSLFHILKPPNKLHPTLSCWIKKMDKRSIVIGHLQELASSAPEERRSQLLGQVVALRAALKKSQDHFMEFLQLGEDHANRYLVHISDEIQQQSFLLDKLEESLDPANILRKEAVRLKRLFNSKTVAAWEDFRTAALSRPLPVEVSEDLFSKVDLVLTEIDQCYMKFDKFWTEEMSRARESLKMRRVDRADFERWKSIFASLEQTIVFLEVSSGDAQTPCRHNACQSSPKGVDIGAIAASLSSEMGSLESALKNLSSINSIKCSQSGQSSIQLVYVAFSGNRDVYLDFLRQCAHYGKEMTDWRPPVASPKSSCAGASHDFRERTLRLRSKVADVSVEIVVSDQGSRKSKSAYNKALRLEREMTSGLNTLLERLLSWVTDTDGHVLPDAALPYVITLERYRELWEKERYSVCVASARLKNEPISRLASTRPRSLKQQLLDSVPFS